MSTKVAGEDITVDGSPLKTSPALVQLFENIVANTLILGQIKKSPLGEIILSRIKNGPGDVEDLSTNGARFERGDFATN